MNESAKLVAAMVGGYALGRTKKGRKALSLALWWASRKYGLQPRELIARGWTRLAGSEAGAQLIEQVRGPLVDAGRRAAMATLQGGVGSLAKNLGDRASSITDLVGSDDEKPEQEPKSDSGRAGGSRPAAAAKRVTKTAKPSRAKESGGSTKKPATRASRSGAAGTSRSTGARRTSRTTN